MPVGIVLLLLVAPTVAQGGSARYRDPGAPVGERVEDLLRRMTVDEKIAQLVATHGSMGVVKPYLATGLGSAKYSYLFSCSSNITACITQRNNLQSEFLNTSRLG
eukprot:Sspe_Gene.119521::Locus_115647_Transcript_1_2_Confidence_0.750_Length_358::g.119521::m.119521